MTVEQFKPRPGKRATLKTRQKKLIRILLDGTLRRFPKEFAADVKAAVDSMTDKQKAYLTGKITFY